MPVWLQAGLWGGFAGGALVLGALIAWFATVPQRVVASVMAFGAGVLVSGALLDGIPESVVLGLSLLSGKGVGVPVLAAFCISNLPEGLSSAAGMKRNGRSARYVFGVWTAIATASGAAGLLGCLLLQGASDQLIAAITALAAGAILTMVSDTMIPEAFEDTHLYAGLITTLGFLTAFVITRAG